MSRPGELWKMFCLESKWLSWEKVFPWRTGDRMKLCCKVCNFIKKSLWESCKLGYTEELKFPLLDYHTKCFVHSFHVFQVCLIFYLLHLLGQSQQWKHHNNVWYTSKSTIKTLKRRHWHCSSVFIVIFDLFINIWHIKKIKLLRSWNTFSSFKFCCKQ